jgi:hypothetical protein
MSISQDQLFTIVNLTDLHARTQDPEISMKLKTLINSLLDEINKPNEVPHELEN